MLDAKDLLKLVSNSELEPFAKLLDCTLTTPNPREELAVVIQSCSRTKVLSALIAINGVWLTMMRDVVQFLERKNVSMRTTGCIIALPINGKETRLYLSPQIADFIVRFDESSVRGKTITHWDDALTEWWRLEYWIQGTINYGMPYRDKRLSHDKMMDAAIRRMPTTDIYEDEIIVNHQASERMFCLWRTLVYLNAKLEDLEDLPHLPEAAKDLKWGLARLATSLTYEIEEMRRDYLLWRELVIYMRRDDPWSDSWTVEELFQEDCWQYSRDWDEWIRFIEDVLAIASLEKSSEVADLLRLDLLKDRPRLFEIWCMSQILSMYQSWGCVVEVESVKAGDPPVWNLNFSRASEPVARIEYGGTQWWFFYQLFRTGTERANMPDLALLKGRSADSDVIWIADPKYSEAGGYSRNDYVEVAERYRDAFQPQHTWICEFFARREWFGGDCHATGDRISILSEVQPKGEGIRILQRDLRRIHSLPLNEFVLAVDCSGSFMDKLQKLEIGLQKLVTRAAAVICFAGEAEELTGAIPIKFAAVQIEGGTYLRPLVSTLETLSGRDPSHTTLVLVTDGGFSDSTDELRTNLEKLFVRVEQVEDESSLTRIIAEYCAVA
jgi:hypothetical protein